MSKLIVDSIKETMSRIEETPLILKWKEEQKDSHQNEPKNKPSNESNKEPNNRNIRVTIFCITVMSKI
jgi:hypothetical protein